MSESARRYLVGLGLTVLAGSLLGAIYGAVTAGLAVAALVAVGWHAYFLLTFETSLRSGKDGFPYGDGIWQSLFARFRYERGRGDRHKRRYRQLLREIRRSTDALPDGALILNDDNEIVLCNKAAKRLAGFRRNRDRGQRVDNILRSPALSALLQSEGFGDAIEIPSPVCENGWLNCRIVPYGGDQKLLIIRDVTERIRLSKMRRDFVANASHELRSPLTVVSGYIDSLADDGDLPADWIQPVRQMQAQSRRMSRVIDELLELSRIESQGPADDEIIDVGGLLDSARAAQDARAQGPAIRLQVDSASRLRGDRHDIESVVTNLLTNAIRHTPAKGEITLGWRSGAEGGVLWVQDTGEGIAPEHQPRLTERFFRVDRGRSREGGGVGLGLAIVKHALNRHDAQLSIDSEPGAGSLFECRFPLQRVVVEPPVRAVTKL